MKPIPASRWEELKRLEEALSFSTEGDRDDEHVRYRVFQEAVPRLNLGGVAEAFFAALAADPDRAMASGVAGLILLPGVPAQLASATEQAVADSKWVGRRIKELDLYDRCLPSSASDFQAALADASGWLEERLAADTESTNVLTFLESHATRRRARHEARSRLRLIRSQGTGDHA